MSRLKIFLFVACGWNLVVSVINRDVHRLWIACLFFILATKEGR